MKKMTQEQLKTIQKLRKSLPPGVEVPKGFGLWTVRMQIIWLQDNQPK